MTYPNPPQPMYASGSVPGRALGIAGLIVDFFVPLLGLILSIVGKVQSRRAGVPNTPATVGIVLGIVFTIATLIAVVVIVLGIVALANECGQLGPGVHHVNGVTYTCS